MNTPKRSTRSRKETNRARLPKGSVVPASRCSSRCFEVTLEEWQRVLAVNLTGPFLMTEAVAPIMRDQGGGAIVNITSISGLRASTLRVA